MRKRKVLHVLLLLNLLIASAVPKTSHSAFDAPDPDPISFSMANLLSFPDFLIPHAGGQKCWYLATGGARLFEMPEIQPFGIRTGGPGFGGRWHLIGKGLKAGVYSELYSGLGYGRRLFSALYAELEVCALQVAIKGYGSAWSSQFNARARWLVQPGLELAFSFHNITDARIGADRYPLPRRISMGGHFRPMPRLHLFLELEKDTRYALESRFGVASRIYGPVTLLAGFHSDPDILSTGLSCLIGSIRATAAFQYHPDLGISQCYGLVLAF